MFFTDKEITVLTCLIDGLIPDDDGFGAASANVITFIKNLFDLDFFYEDSVRWKEIYKTSLSKINSYETQIADGMLTFENKERNVQFLEKMSKNDILGWDDSVVFFELLRTHTIYGYLSDPKYGGNQDKIGWKFYGNKFFN